MTLSAQVVAAWVAQSDHPHDEGDGEKGVKQNIKDIPKTDIVSAHLPDL
jgi:hypothetical protein